MGDLLDFPRKVKKVEEDELGAFSLRCDKCVHEWITEDKDERCPLCDDGEHVDIVCCWGSE